MCDACVKYDKVLRAKGTRVATMEIEANLYDVVTSKLSKDFENMQDVQGHLLAYRRGRFVEKYHGEDEIDSIDEFVMSAYKKYGNEKKPKYGKEKLKRKLSKNVENLAGPSWLSNHPKVKYQIEQIQKSDNPKSLVKAYDKLLATVERISTREMKDGDHLDGFSSLIEGLFPVETLQYKLNMLKGKEGTPEFAIVKRHLREAKRKSNGIETVPVISEELKMIERLEAKLENAAGPDDVKRIAQHLKQIRSSMHQKLTRLDRGGL